MSKKQSDTQPLRRMPALLLDENMSSPDIAIPLRHFRDWRIVMHQDCRPPLYASASDVEVIEFCASKGWALISSDDRIRYVPESKVAAERVGLQSFMMVRKDDTTGIELHSALVAARHQILRNSSGGWALREQ